MSRRLDKLRLRLRSLFRPSAVDRELARELRAHLDEEIANNVASGMTPAEARRAAVLAFGPVTSKTVPQAAEPAKSAGDSATYVPEAAASG